MTTDTSPIQQGPLYTCFSCGGPAVIGRSWNEAATMFVKAGWSTSPLDAWGKHIFYLQKPCRCKPIRVVRLGDCIAPLTPALPDGTLAPEDIPQIRDMLGAIARAVPLESLRLEPATRIVYGLMVGTLTPDEAIAEINVLTNDNRCAPTLALPLQSLEPARSV